MDEEKMREEEIRLFGQVRSFIECTEHIQGNMYVSQWKGSVLDSVVGAFLTQNVSDISSSSSFLSLMANFPLKENVAEQDRKRTRGQKMANARNLLGKGKKSKDFGWHSLKNEAYFNGYKYEETDENKDSLDWEAVRCAEVGEISDTIKTRGQSNVMAARIKGFLNRLFRECGSLDLEWLRFIPPDETKNFLLSIEGLGLKSVECIRLLTLKQLAFPVDTNVARISVRLGWVPITLPENNQLHELENYPKREDIQKYLWSYLHQLDQHILYLLHYKMITFGKVFCTKKNPNCYSCPMKGECKHFASAHVSGASEEGGCRQLVHTDMEDIFKQEENKFAHQNMTRDTKNKHVSSLRTMHDAYVLPDSHPLLEGMDRREYADPCPYLLHVWTPETCNDNAHLSTTQESEIFKGTILIPCRTATRGRFPLNGTYFQANEVFADDETTQNPIIFRRNLIQNLERTIIYTGNSTRGMYKEQSLEKIFTCFKNGFICTRAYDRRTGSPKPIPGILHKRGSKTPKRTKGQVKEAKNTPKDRETILDVRQNMIK
ncbi:DEMETER-like protein 2 isoform X4 [Canna indica]|uniref:DEMETER-like protein 2 isoform X4 n=1 Tax=Canna indica TaxID=4628 RepID=A0AAQ3PZJ7_9LILI|nr:DEMETER-like protein 2 isoform X4 [Canna indica]